MLHLRGIPFQRVWNASGARNFDGSGWWFHKIPGIHRMGLDFGNATFQAKTTTLRPRLGNMSLKEDGITPVDLIPDCIHVNMRRGFAVNCVGLSGPGLAKLLESGVWQNLADPFAISFMSVAKTREERTEELEEAVWMLHDAKPRFKAPFAMCINGSCPNVGLNLLSHGFEEFIDEAHAHLEIARRLDAPVIYKINVTIPPDVAKRIASHEACDAICQGNTLPWGRLPDRIDWKSLFGSDVSPLAKIDPNGGGLSGAPLFPLVLEWIQEAIRLNFPKPLIACGGILQPSDALQLLSAGAAAIEIGSMAFLRPWRVRATVDAVLAWSPPVIARLA